MVERSYRVPYQGTMQDRLPILIRRHLRCVRLLRAHRIHIRRERIEALGVGEIESGLVAVIKIAQISDSAMSGTRSSCSERIEERFERAIRILKRNGAVAHWSGRHRLRALGVLGRE